MKNGKPKIPKALISSYDVIGDIAIVDIPKGKEEEAKEIAESIIKVHPHIKTVLEKKSDRFGRFRLRELKPIIGRERATEHHESSCRFRLDVTKAYFSPREGTERERIAAQVKAGETVLVMFAGVGPFAIIIGKRQPRVRKVFAVEINPDAVKYMKENIRLNGLTYVVEPICGDAKNVCRKLYRKCSRVIMPLPHEGSKFLETAIKCLKPKGIIHFYYIGPKNDMFTVGKDIIRMECKKLGRKFRILKQKRVLPYRPGMYKVCIDFQVG
jgi:tRNA (guanine37-N1)-methyltransferase